MVRSSHHQWEVELVSLVPPPLAALPPGEIARELALLGAASGIKFANYKQMTVNRRILHRMSMQKIKYLKEYVDYLRQNPAEVESLYQDILINVTSFFRDPEAFNTLGRLVIPHIVKNRTPDAYIRIWVPTLDTP